MEANGIALGLLAALCWGVADFCARGATQAGGTLRTLLVVQVLGIAGLLALALPIGLLSMPSNPLLVLAAAGINLLILGGAGLLYRALAIGTLAIVSPIAASFAAITALLALASGERPTPLAFLGIGLTLVGVVLASATPGLPAGTISDEPHHGPPDSTRHTRPRRWTPAPGLVEALATMLVFGLGYWLLRFVTPVLGGATVALIGKVADLLVLGVIAGAVLLFGLRRQTQAGPAGETSSVPTNGASGLVIGRGRPREGLPAAFWLAVVPVGVLDTGANVAYNVGITQGLTSVVVVLSSLFSAVTVLLAWVFLRERLAAWQWAGVLAILVGIALVNL